MVVCLILTKKLTKDSRLLGCDAASLGGNKVPCLQKHTATRLGLLDPEDEGNIILRNIRKYSPTVTASHPS
jgi:hypothetical protein